MWHINSIQSGRRVFALAVAMTLLAVMVGCGEPRNNSRAVVVLIDIHGDYASEMEQARSLTNFLLATLNSGDSIAIAFIDNSSFTERNYIVRADFDHRPSVTTAQKRQVRKELDAFLERFRVPSAHSDITGGILLASDYLRESDAGHRTLFILSDLQEDLMPGMKRDLPLGLDDVQVVAVNVTRLRGDNYDPAAYQARLLHWQERVESSGGRWRVANDLSRLEQMALMQ
ncbi:VWA domain-containing protein [Natronospira bacteriovora]|uniref:VWA domain-containing protein n=1 Tax=Natronospira bacteriovora TaxID=3069753 RepID=A0ABU0W6E5_9GAMM|nr:VWA domain-containing protein [Natronospira sp. AB-CW4]MDQ2069597.1 VWA domain-containing protein [Natronospira sp. AB-CW4]